MDRDSGVEALLAGRDAAARRAAAERTGALLCTGSVGADRRAAELLARRLARDAVEEVRAALARSVAADPLLPKDIAKRIAHDVAQVAGPFLAVTEVFSDAELADLVLTVEEGARMALARRARVGRRLTNRLCEIAGPAAVRVLLENDAACLQSAVARDLLQRFDGEPSVLEALAARNELPMDVVEVLLARVCGAVQSRLCRRYGLETGLAVRLVSDARAAALLRIISRAPATALLGHARDLRKAGELCPHLVLRAVRLGCVEFFCAAAAVQAGKTLQQASQLCQSGDPSDLRSLIAEAGFPAELRGPLQDAVTLAVAERASA